MRQKYSENYFDVGIIAVEISCAGPTSTVIFFLYVHILDIFARLRVLSTYGRVIITGIRDSARHNVISKYIFRGGACAVRMLSQSARIMKRLSACVLQ